MLMLGPVNGHWTPCGGKASDLPNEGLIEGDEYLLPC